MRFRWNPETRTTTPANRVPVGKIVDFHINLQWVGLTLEINGQPTPSDNISQLRAKLADSPRQPGTPRLSEPEHLAFTNRPNPMRQTHGEFCQKSLKTLTPAPKPGFFPPRA
jgi:hypothetical protein